MPSVYTYRVANIVCESPDIFTLSLTHADGTCPVFSVGQVIDVYFPETGISYGKPYSISNAPKNESLAITVRAIGSFSNRLCTMRRGDMVRASAPYGSFRPKHTASDIVLIAASMGVTPFRGMLTELIRNNPQRRITLLRSARTARDCIFQHDLAQLKKLSPYFSYAEFITRESPASPHVCQRRRIVAEDVHAHIQEMSQTEFLVCGSFSFVESMQREMQQIEVPKESVQTSCISSLAGVFQ